ncbi:MAG TPA: hypothetical protein VEL74_12490 [Thermoanaerobaculia bacterium]|nr:hypothetical protein [Thermoanaerobaculia bacterium]
MAWGKKKSGGGGGVAWLALIVALAALFLAWKAYERTGGDLDGILRLPVGEMEVGEGEGDETAVERQAGLAQARARLLARRTEVAARRNLRQAQEEVAEVRDQLQGAYKGAGDQAREGWRELDADLERLQGQLRDGGSRAVETLDSVVDKMRRIGEDG